MPRLTVTLPGDLVAEVRARAGRGGVSSWIAQAATERLARERLAVVAQAWRGRPRQARLAKVVAGAELIVADGTLSRRAGELLGRARTTDVLDALVALAAQDRPGHEVLTSDPADIHHLLLALGIQRTIRAV